MFEYSSPRRTSVDVAPPVTPSPADDSRRRYAIEYLEQFEYPVELRTLATYVAAAEQNLPVEAVSDATRERVAIQLHHVDVPELLAEGYIDYDSESRMAVYVGTKTERGYVDDRGLSQSGPA